MNIYDHKAYGYVPTNAIRSPNVGLMLGHRLRRWPNSKPTLGRCIVFAG